MTNQQAKEKDKLKEEALLKELQQARNDFKREAELAAQDQNKIYWKG